MQGAVPSSSSSSSSSSFVPPPMDPAAAAYAQWCAGRVPVRVQDLLENIGKVGEGGYGEVFKARVKATGQVVAVKKLLRNHEKEGFPITSIREIKLLREIDSPNVVKVQDIVTSSETDNVFVLFEYMEHDLDGLLHTLHLPPSHVKCYMHQLLLGLLSLHSRGIMHRDLKPSNILLDNRGGLRICDFGFARYCRASKQDSLYTPVVVTMWYRAPEVLLAYADYGIAIDMWSVGCILFEMCALGKVLFNGKDELDQLTRIYEVCGTPTVVNCPQLPQFPVFGKVQPAQAFPRTLVDKCQRNHLSEDAAALVDRLLDYNLDARATTTEAMQHPYFRTPPLPENPANIPSYEDKHKWVFRSKRRKELADKQSRDKDAAQAQKAADAAAVARARESHVSTLAKVASRSSRRPDAPAGDRSAPRSEQHSLGGRADRPPGGPPPVAVAHPPAPAAPAPPAGPRGLGDMPLHIRELAQNIFQPGEGPPRPKRPRPDP